MTSNLTNKVALVTGASRGIGRAAAIALARAGAHVAVHYHRAAEQARAACDEIRAMGRKAVAIQANVAQAAELARIVPAVETELGPVEILVNNAGLAQAKPIEQITEADFDALMAINLKSAFMLTQAVLPKMRAARWGRVIMLSSIAAQQGGVIGPHYAASKAGMIGLTHSYASLLAKDGVTVNAIAPALVYTDMVADNPRARPEVIPVGRLGHVDEVADIVVLLARNGYMTGQTISVNGGWYMS
ncbi:MAG: short-chain dehydrogenase [Phycisphaerae bacterium]